MLKNTANSDYDTDDDISKSKNPFWSNQEVKG